MRWVVVYWVLLLFTLVWVTGCSKPPGIYSQISIIDVPVCPSEVGVVRCRR